jgi:23S rRNA (cytosine1962-C5)-methyltransferase
VTPPVRRTRSPLRRQDDHGHRSRGRPPPLDLQLVAAAVERRRAWCERAPLDVLRLIDGEGDGLPGVVLDRYGAYARLELWAPSWPDDDDASDLGLQQALVSCGVRGAVGVLRTAAGQSTTRPLFGDVPEAHVVHEEGLRFLVRLGDDKAVGAGVFVDQRLGRGVVRAHARGRVVVNLFAHAGAFGVAAGVGGAARIDHVDMAKKCAPWAATNLALNGLDPRGHRFIVDDALHVLLRLARRGPSTGIIVCDPPTQAVRIDGSRFVLRESLAELAELAARALEKDGLLLLSCNDREVAVDVVLAAANEGATAAGRSIKSLVELPLPQDITSNKAPKGRPMRGALLRLHCRHLLRSQTRPGSTASWIPARISLAPASSPPSASS